MNDIEVLEKARGKLCRGWVANKRGVGHCGEYRSGNSPMAVAWCALGALDAALDTDECCRHPIGIRLIRRLSQGIKDPLKDTFPETAVAEYSNRSGQAKTIALFDTTIRKLKMERMAASATFAMGPRRAA